MNNKKTIVALLLIAIIGIVGLTIAYFSNSTSVENTFTTKEYGTTYTETFVSPDNWLPGDTTDKTLVATNTGDVDEALRVKIIESWEDSNGNSLALSKNGVAAAIINLDNASDWTKIGDYYYYDYKLAPGESARSFIKSVTFNPAIQLDNTCTSSTSNGVTTTTCNSSGTDYDNATYTLTLEVETVQFNKYKTAWGVNLDIAENTALTVNEFVTNNSNASNATYGDNTKSKMFTFTHGTDTENRYIGDAPNNYVYFNCTDDTDVSTCEKWRIMGVFNVDDGNGNVESRIKLISGSALSSKMNFDTSGGTYGTSYWTNADINTYLNGTYYNSLSATSKSMIGNANYYLGSRPQTENDVFLGSTEEFYSWERGTVVHEGRNTTWTGKIGLMYLSDEFMVYANGVESTCYTTPYLCDPNEGADPTKGWILNSNILSGGSSTEDMWTMVSFKNSDSRLFNIISTGPLYEYYANGSFGVRPVAYLNSDVRIASGTGTSADPFVLKN